MVLARLGVLGACSALMVGLAVPAFAVTNVSDNEACDTTAAATPVTTCFTGPTAIQQAVAADTGGGTVNVGKGTFAGPVSITTDGLTLNGSGQGTISTGTIDDSTSTSLIYAYKNSPGFTHPLTIQNLNLRGTVLAGKRGSEITLKDQNQNNLDTITNNWFTVASGTQGSVRGLYSYNSYAPLVLNRNTFSHTQYGVLLETGGGSGSTTFGSNTITYNLFDHLTKAPSPLGAVAAAIQLSIDNPGPATAEAQNYSDNTFVFDNNQVNSTGLDVYGHGSGPTATSNNGLPTTIEFHSNNLTGVALGVLNETTQGPMSATDTFWGCSQGPDVNPASDTDTGANGCADVYGAPAYTYTTPYLTGPAHLEEVGAT
jgi:hypothetical protein